MEIKNKIMIYPLISSTVAFIALVLKYLHGGDSGKTILVITGMVVSFFTLIGVLHYMVSPKKSYSESSFFSILVFLGLSFIIAAIGKIFGV